MSGNKKNENKILIGIMIGAIVISLITIVLVCVKKNKPVVNEPNINYEMEQDKIITLSKKYDTGSVKVPNNAATKDDVVEQLKSVNANINVAGIIEKVSLNDNNELNITRYQLADMLYNIIKNENKLPVFNDTKLYFDDADEILEQYATQIRYTSYLRLYEFGWKFNGFQFITKEQLNYSMQKLNEYLNNYIPESTPENNENGSRGEGMPNEDLDNIEEEKINQVIQERDYSDTERYKDKLNGQSVAIYKNPKNKWEIEQNIAQIRKVNITDYNDKTFDKNKETISVDYVNLHEGLVDYSYLESLEQFKNLEIGDKLVGVTYIEDIELKVEKFEEFSTISNNLQEQLIYGRLSFPNLVVSIKDGRVIGYGVIPDDVENPDIWMFGRTDYDSIGLLASKGILEGTQSNEYVFVIINVKDW